MAKSRWGFEFQSSYKPQGLTYPPANVNGMYLAYRNWLCETRDWEGQEADAYIAEMNAKPRGVLSAQFFGTPEAHEKAPKINWRNEARKALQYLRMGEHGAALAILMKAA